MTTAVWVVLFVARVQAHQINVDDYAYANVARLCSHANPVSSFLHTGTTSPLVPALAAPGADIGGVYGAMTVELPFFLMLVAGSFFLARLWFSPLAAMVAALLLPSMRTYRATPSCCTSPCPLQPHWCGPSLRTSGVGTFGIGSGR